MNPQSLLVWVRSVGAEATRWDAIARFIRSEATRRVVLRGLIGAGGAALLADLLQTEAAPPLQPGCRGAGKTCEGNQQCCAGLVCTVTAQGNSRRCAEAPTRTPTPTNTPTL